VLFVPPAGRGLAQDIATRRDRIGIEDHGCLSRGSRVGDRVFVGDEVRFAEAGERADRDQRPQHSAFAERGEGGRVADRLEAGGVPGTGGSIAQCEVTVHGGHDRAAVGQPGHALGHPVDSPRHPL
jgi:hypothetical protein